MEWDGKVQSWPSWGRDLGLCGSTRGPPPRRVTEKRSFGIGTVSFSGGSANGRSFFLSGL